MREWSHEIPRMETNDHVWSPKLSRTDPARGGPSSSQCRGERESQRFKRFSTENGQMEACRESKNTVFRNINVQLVSVTAPTA